MTMTISSEGELQQPPEWIKNYEILRGNIVSFCKEQNDKNFPNLVKIHFESVGTDFWIDTAPGTEPGGDTISWANKKQSTQCLLEITDDMLAFGNKDAFPAAIRALHELRKMLATIIQLIPG